MRPAAEIARFARAAAREIARESDLAQFEIYCASADVRVARLNFTSDVPCRGVEELKSHEATGFQVRIVPRRNPREIGVAFEAGDLSLATLRAALSRARGAAIVDPHFPGLPAGAAPTRPSAAAHRALARADDATLAAAAWQAVRGAADAFAAREVAPGRQPGLVVGGDVSIIRDRIALAGSNFAGVRTDDCARFDMSVTVLIESLDAKATATASGSSLAALRSAATRIGSDAFARSLALARGVRPSSGRYRVVLGPQPVAEILNYMVLGSLTTGSFFAASSAFQGRFGARVMDRRLSLSDDPRRAGGAIRRTVTCEGLAARHVRLISEGRLVGLLSNFYDSHRLQTDPERAEKLGREAGGKVRFPPGSGYRLGEAGERRYDDSPASAGTNVVMRARGAVSDAHLIRSVSDGIYIGRVWYTYPINGERAGDFTCTVSGDSFLIRDGRPAEPLAPNSLRVNANIRDVFTAPLAVGARLHLATVWGSPQAYYVPGIAVSGLELEAVGGAA
jgi:PmbA protein